MGKNRKHDENDLLDDDDVDTELDDEQGDEHEEDDGGTKTGKEGDGQDDERLVSQEDTGDEDDEEAIKKRRREERLERKRRREEAIRRDKTELRFLRDQNDQLERRMKSLETGQQQNLVSQVDARIEQVKHDLATAETVLAAAMKAGNGDDTVKAMNFRDQARDRLKRLTEVRVQAQQRQESGGSEVDPAMLRNARQFMSKLSWYDPRGGDEDSAVVLGLDQGLAAGGYDPRTQAYWDELEKRVKRKLPHRFKADQHDDDLDDDQGGHRQRGPKGPQLGGGRSSGAGTEKRGITISPERKAAMVEAGVWDDPKLRAKYIKRYQEYDREHKSGTGR